MNYAYMQNPNLLQVPTRKASQFSRKGSDSTECDSNTGSFFSKRNSISTNTSVRGSFNSSRQKIGDEGSVLQDQIRWAQMQQRNSSKVPDKRRSQEIVDIEGLSCSLPIIGKHISEPIEGYSYLSLLKKNKEPQKINIRELRKNIMQKPKQRNASKHILEPLVPHRDIQEIPEIKVSKPIEEVGIHKDRNLEQALLQDIYSTIDADNVDSTSKMQHKQHEHESEQKNAKNHQLYENYLDFHEVDELLRSRMINWMIQVFRVMRVSSPQTFFLSVSLLDRYLNAKRVQSISIKKKEFYLIGLGCIFISSKYEDITPISMEALLEDAGYEKFKQSQILEMEADILSSIGFNLSYKSIYEVANVIYKSTIYSIGKNLANKKMIQEGQQYLSMLSYLSLFDVHNMIMDPTSISIAIVKLTFRYIKSSIKQQLLSINSKLVNDEQIKNYKIAKNLANHFKSIYINANNLRQIKEIKERLLISLIETQACHDKHNLEKDFPKFFQKTSPWIQNRIKLAKGFSVEQCDC